MPDIPTPDAGPLEGAGAAMRNAAGDGLEVAREFAGEVVRAAMPEGALDRIPFLVIDVTNHATELLEVL